MKPIKVTGDDGKCIGLLVNSSTGNVLTREELESLKPYILHAVTLANIELINNNLVITENASGSCLSFENLTDSEKEALPNLLENIQEACKKHLAEKLIVPQDMGNLPSIRHRPLYFSADKETSTIQVKFTILGDFNNFTAALNDLNNLYPEALTNVADTNADTEYQPEGMGMRMR